MKILQLISTLNPEYGGPVEGLKQMSLALSQLGHDVKVGTFDDPKSPWLSKFPIETLTFGRSYSKFRLNFNFIPWIRLNAHKFDVVIINGIWQFHSVGAWYSLRASKVPYFIYPHGMMDPWFKKAYPIKHIKKLLFWILFERFAFQCAKAILFTTAVEQNLASQSFWPYECKSFVSKFGITGFKGDRKYSSELFFNNFPKLKGKKIFLFLSRIHRKKGCDLLLHAFSKISTIDDTRHLLFIGPDEDGWRADLERMAEKLGVSAKVSWLGMVNDDLKWGAYNSSEAFVLPSHSENFGSVVPEALSCGLPVLISNKINISDLIRKDGAGFVENDDLDGVDKLFNIWLSISEEQKLLMRQAAYRCFIQNFEISSAAHKLSQLLSAEPEN